ncbi:Zinc finger, GRF-type [Sesbania bispinosa]|nr:Zinc finger, GRF-type [Sesbania bispinosa]
MKGGGSYSQKNSGRCTSSSSSISRARRCRCGENLILFTSNSEKNPGRDFWRCRLWDIQMSCNYFQWADEELPEGTAMRTDNSVEEMKMKISKLRLKLAAERKSRRMKLFLLYWLGLSLF